MRIFRGYKLSLFLGKPAKSANENVKVNENGLSKNTMSSILTSNKVDLFQRKSMGRYREFIAHH